VASSAVLATGSPEGSDISVSGPRSKKKALEGLPL